MCALIGLLAGRLIDETIPGGFYHTTHDSDSIIYFWLDVVFGDTTPLRRARQCS